MRRSTMVANAASISRSLPALKMRTGCPRISAAACTSGSSERVRGGWVHQHGDERRGGDEFVKQLLPLRRQHLSERC